MMRDRLYPLLEPAGIGYVLLIVFLLILVLGGQAQ